MTITLHSLNLSQAERALCEHALRTEGTLVGAAERLGITRHSLKRRILKHNILWPIPRTGIRPGMFDPDTTLLSVTPQPRNPHSVPAQAASRPMTPTVMSASAPTPSVPTLSSPLSRFGQR
ncbi:MAG: hypothetical protein H6713_12950 [Myxococcales bacterium]|nr:hypothetical protein [Myxococcales bacterium]MCB9750888.1 hypothetical protein [Myxococcales bacterium]